jgi:hypothetical protein
MMTIEFKPGDRVEKVGGRYGGPGRIVGIADHFDDGHVLYNVAHQISGGYGEFVHVYPASNLRLLPEHSTFATYRGIRS